MKKLLFYLWLLRVQVIEFLIIYFWGLDIGILYLLNVLLIKAIDKDFEEKKLSFLSFFINSRE